MSVLQTVRYNVERGLSGVLAWQHFIVRNFTAQMAVIDIITPKGNKYELIARSAAEAPPLGQVVLRIVHNPTTVEEVIEGQNQDRTWLQVCEFLKARETGDSSDNAAAKARAIAEPAAERAPDELENPIPSIPFVYFIAQKGEFYRNGWAFVTTMHPDGTLDLTVSARNHESYHVERVAERSEQLRNHCYVDVTAMRAQQIEDAVRRMVEEEVAKRVPLPPLMAGGLTGVTEGVHRPNGISLTVASDEEIAATLMRAGNKLDTGQIGDPVNVIPMPAAEVNGVLVLAKASVGEHVASELLALQGAAPNRAGFETVDGASPQAGNAQTDADPANPNSDLAYQFGDTAGMSAEDVEAMKQLARETGGDDALAQLERQLAGGSAAPTIGA